MLEQIKEGLVDNLTSNDAAYFEAGFNACMDLELPIKFAEWLGDKRFNRNTWFDETNHCMDMVTTKELFQEFLNDVYGK